MFKLKKIGYIIPKDLEIENYFKKGMCPDDGLIEISSQNKPYSSEGNGFLSSIREALIDNLFEQGFEIEGQQYKLSESIHDFLRNVEQHLLPDDIFDAIYWNKSPNRTEKGISEYTNPNTKTVIRVKISQKEIVSVYLRGKKSERNISKSSQLKNSFTNNDFTHIIKSTGYVLTFKGTGTVCGDIEITFEDMTIQIDDRIFDPDQKDKYGRTNVERMKKGRAPIGKDGKPINLHHLKQNPKGPLKEILGTEHSKNNKILHTDRGPSRINRK